MSHFLYSLLFFSIFIISAYFFRNKLRGMKNPSLYCPNHPRSIPTNICQVCDVAFCDKCSSVMDGLTFCCVHLEKYKSKRFKLYKTATSSSKLPDEGVELYEYREELKKQGKLSYLKISYHEDENQIYTQTQLYIMD
ncbi:MAG: hypothetical protein H6622_02810 [Halobacteriovoraceae bacterium]|nr:hypothetical protein [Halobacteriovoraceae bacterium]